MTLEHHVRDEGSRVRGSALNSEPHTHNPAPHTWCLRMPARRIQLDRRAFLAGGAAMICTVASDARAQQPRAPGQGNLFDMNQGAARSVRRPPKPDAKPSMTDDQRDALEHEIRCQCGCTLDVYICRTTDFSCQVSPAMHRDIMSLVQGGYSAQEIIDAFVDAYGEKALMAPKREGFNLAGYLAPFAAILIGAVALVSVIRRMQQTPRGEVPETSNAAMPVDATADEMARIEAAVRRDD